MMPALSHVTLLVHFYIDWRFVLGYKYYVLIETVLWLSHKTMHKELTEKDLCPRKCLDNNDLEVVISAPWGMTNRVLATTFIT